MMNQGDKIMKNKEKIRKIWNLSQFSCIYLERIIEHRLSKGVFIKSRHFGRALTVLSRSFCKQLLSKQRTKLFAV